MEITVFQFFILSLAVFRLTRLIVYDQITEFIRKPFMMDVEEIDENGKKEIYIVPRNGGVRGFIGELLSCYWCTGIWATIAIVLIHYYLPTIAAPLIFILAIAGAAAMIETYLQAKINQ